MVVVEMRVGRLLRILVVTIFFAYYMGHLGLDIQQFEMKKMPDDLQLPPNRSLVVIMGSLRRVGEGGNPSICLHLFVLLQNAEIRKYHPNQ